MTRDRFVYYMEELYKCIDAQNRFSDAMAVYFDSWVLFRDKELTLITSLIGEVVGDKGDWLNYFLWDNPGVGDTGKFPSEGVPIWLDGDDEEPSLRITDWGMVYDLIRSEDDADNV